MAKVSTTEILSKVGKAQRISEKDMKLLLKRRNEGEKFNDAIFWDGSIALDRQHMEKGLKWLKNQWKTPSGKERKNNPFGYREEFILETAKKMYLRGFYDAGNMFRSFFVPLYEVEARDGDTMQYYLSGGKINIIG